MEPKPFLEKLKVRHPKAVSELSYFGLTWNQWAKFTKMASSLNYGCNFNANGRICSGHTESADKSTEMCCCRGCLTCVGYLSLIPNDEQIIKEIAYLFDKKYGFWRKKKGCILPVKYRSATCVGYRCADARKYRNDVSPECSFDCLEQMVLYFLETLRSDRLSATQIRTIIKEFIKLVNFYPFCNEGADYE